MRKQMLLVATLLMLTLAGCSQGGGNCGPILQYCEPEETSAAPADPGGGVVPPGGVGTGSPVIGTVTLFAGATDPMQRSVEIPVTVTVTHMLADSNEIPLVQDPYTKVMMPNGYTFPVPKTPFTYTVELKADTTQIDFVVTGSIRTDGAITCTLFDGAGVEIPGASRVSFAPLQIEGVPVVTVTCTWFLGM